MNKHFLTFSFGLWVLCAAFCSNKQNSNAQTDCLNLSLMDLNDKHYGNIGKWKYSDATEHLSTPRYMNDITFFCDGKPVTGKVFELDEQGIIITNGYLKNGKVTDEWNYIRDASAGTTRMIFKGTILFELSSDNKVMLLDYKQFRNDTLMEHCAAIDNENYVDTLFRMNPYGVYAISSGKEFGRSNFLKDKRLRIFKENGDLEKVYIEDSLHIEWLEKDDSSARDLNNGYSVDIIQGKAERCYKYKRNESTILYVGKDYNGNYYPHGLFVNFDAYGKPDSVFINLNQEAYK